MTEIWTLLTQTPETFKGGDIWRVITGVNNALVGIGYGLLVLFFAIGIFQSAASFRDFQRPEFALRHFIRFIIAKVAVGSCMELMTAIFNICGGIVNTVMGSMGASISTTATLPTEIVTAIESLGLLESIPLWLVSLLGTLVITVLSFVLLLTVYGRFFRPVPVHRPGAPSPGLICRGGHLLQRETVCQILYRRLHGGGGGSPRLHHLLRVPVQQYPGGGRHPGRRHHDLAVCGAAHFQYAHPHRPYAAQTVS